MLLIILAGNAMKLKLHHSMRHAFAIIEHLGVITHVRTHIRKHIYVYNK